MHPILHWIKEGKNFKVWILCGNRNCGSNEVKSRKDQKVHQTFLVSIPEAGDSHHVVDYSCAGCKRLYDFIVYPDYLELVICDPENGKKHE